MQRKERIDEVNLVRAFAIIGVLSVHATSFATVDMKASTYYYLYNFANIFFKFGTPTFILLSSFVLFYNYYNQPVSKSLIAGFYKKRLLYILLPYVLFSIGYYLLLHFLYYPHRTISEALWGTANSDGFFLKLITGKAYTHLYFVFISVQFYLLFPLLLLLFKKYPRLSRYAVLIGFAVQWIFFELNHYVWPVPNKGSWAFTYFSYYFTGAFLGIYFTKVKEWLIISRSYLFTRKGLTWLLLWVLWLTFGLLHVQMWYKNRLGGFTIDTTWYELMYNLHTFTSALVLIQLAYIVQKRAKPWFVRTVSHLGVMSFGIYLLHPLFLLVYRQYPVTRTLWVHFWYAGGFVLALLGSWLVVTLFFRFVPSAWVFFGNVPKKYQRQPSVSQGSSPSSSVNV